jgi:hypothetical protein
MIGWMCSRSRGGGVLDLNKMPSSRENVTIYVQLLNEGTICWRPTEALNLGNGQFELLATPGYDATDEEWEFLPGSIVRCEKQQLSSGEVLVAVKA